VAVKGPVDSEPLVGRVLLHPPDALHAVALVEDHVSVEAPPLVTVVGLAVSVTVGAGGDAVTATDTEALAPPPAPVHVSVKLVVAVSGPVDAVPLVGRVLLHPPDALHAVALVEDHVRVEDPPLVTLVGLAVSVTVGAGGDAVTATDTEALALPPAPVHVSV